MLMNNKKDVYRKEIERAENINFVNFRIDEIADIEFALKAYGLFFEGLTEEAVESVYRKDKVVILKKSQCRQTILMITTLENTLKTKRIAHEGEGSEAVGEAAVKF